MSAYRTMPALLLASALGTWSVAVPLQGQAYGYRDAISNVAIEVNTGATLPVGELADVGGGSGLAFSVNLLYDFSPRWTGYVGWDRHNFNCDGCINEIGTSSGPNIGVKYLFDADADAQPWVRGGATWNELDSFQAGTDVQSSRGLGFEAGAGVDFSVSNRVRLAPNGKFAFFRATDLPIEDYTMTYFVLGLSGHYHF